MGEAMPIMQITVAPRGRNESIGALLVPVVRVVRASRLKYEVHSLSTEVEGRLDQLFELARAMHEAGFSRGVGRVITTLQIDDRRDREATIETMCHSLFDRLIDDTR